MKRKANSDYCTVKNCNSLGRNNNKDLHFHKFPKPLKRKVKRLNFFGEVEEIDQLDAWKMVLNITTVLPRMKVCSLHFKKDDYIMPDVPGKSILKRTAVPSLNLPNNKKESKIVQYREERYLMRTLKIENFKNKETKLKKIKKTKSEENDAFVETEMCVKFEDEDRDLINETVIDGSTSSLAGSMQCEGVLLEDANVQCEIPILQDASVQSEAPLVQEISVQANMAFKYINIIENDAALSSVTGIMNFEIFNTITDIVKVATGNKYENLKMNTVDRIIMTYMKLKHNFCYSFLAVNFNCYSAKHCQRVFYDTLKILSNCLKVALPWPTKEEISQNLPKCFSGFENVRIVLDCIEIYIQQPKNLCCQSITYSHYKSSTTAKIMTGVTPAGNISYISKVYGGRVSDSTIFSQSTDLLNLLEAGDGIMVDRGFLIDELCEVNRWKCIRTPFLQKKKQFSNSESLLTSKIAVARVHIKRSHQRIKSFKILGSKMPVGLLPILSDILIVICGTINLSSPILSKEKFMKN